MTAEKIKEVKDFHLRDDISWQAPGQRDTISVNDPDTNKRILKQKRYLLLSIGEAKTIFDEQNGTSLLSLSKFYN